MRVAIIGAGAIGAVLARAAVSTASGTGPGSSDGYPSDVCLCVRTPFGSLSIVDPDGIVGAVPVQIVTTPAAVAEPADVVFLTVKATDTASAGGWLGKLSGPSTLVVVMQNGLDQESRVRPHLPEGVRVVPGLAYIAAERLSAGRVRYLAGRLIVVESWAAPAVSAALPGLRVRGEDDMATAAWEKLLSNLVANPITALTMRRIGVMKEPGIADLARGVLAEAVAVGRASGASLDDSIIETIVEGTARYGPETGSSMLYDRMAGRPMEHQYLTGEVVRRGAAMGVPVPLNSALLALLEAADRGLASQ